MNTSLTLTDDKQGIYCDGGRRNACGLRNVPGKGQGSKTEFLKQINLDPNNPERWLCQPMDDDRNGYRFIGSYYHAYVKLGSCRKPRGKYKYMRGI